MNGMDLKIIVFYKEQLSEREGIVFRVMMDNVCV